MVVYKAGDVIFECKPLVHVLSSKEKRKRCDFCFNKSLHLLPCAGCQEMFYCSDTCRTKDWLSCHRFGECKALSKDVLRACSRHMDIDFYRFLLRFLLKVRRDPLAEERHFLTLDGTVRRLADLVDHAEEVIKEPETMSALAGLRRHLNSNKIRVDLDSLVRFYGQLCVNNFSMDDLGLGLYIEGSALDHSCKPNACPSWLGTVMQVRALRAIDTSSDQVLISYTSLIKPREVRQKILREKFYFDCKCERCSDLNNNDDVAYLAIEEALKRHSELIGSKLYMDAFNVLSDAIPMVQGVCGEHSPFVTVLTAKLLLCLLMSKKVEMSEVSGAELKDMKKRLYREVKITHGLHHQLYFKYQFIMFDSDGRE